MSGWRVYNIKEMTGHWGTAWSPKSCACLPAYLFFHGFYHEVKINPRRDVPHWQFYSFTVYSLYIPTKETVHLTVFLSNELHLNGRFPTTYSLVDHIFVSDVGAILVFSSEWSKCSPFWLKIAGKHLTFWITGEIPLLANYLEDWQSWSMYRCGPIQREKKHSFFPIGYI